MDTNCVVATLTFRVRDLDKFDPQDLAVGLGMLFIAFEADGLALSRVEFKIPKATGAEEPSAT